MSVSASRHRGGAGAALAAANASRSQDDSHLHAGHAGAREGRHFSVRDRQPRASKACSRVARHRLVYDALART